MSGLDGARIDTRYYISHIASETVFEPNQADPRVFYNVGYHDNYLVRQGSSVMICDDLSTKKRVWVCEGSFGEPDSRFFKITNTGHIVLGIKNEHAKDLPIWKIQIHSLKTGNCEGSIDIESEMEKGSTRTPSLATMDDRIFFSIGNQEIQEFSLSSNEIKKSILYTSYRTHKIFVVDQKIVGHVREGEKKHLYYLEDASSYTFETILEYRAPVGEIVCDGRGLLFCVEEQPDNAKFLIRDDLHGKVMKYNVHNLLDGSCITAMCFNNEHAYMATSANKVYALSFGLKTHFEMPRHIKADVVRLMSVDKQVLVGGCGRLEYGSSISRILEVWNLHTCEQLYSFSVENLHSFSYKNETLITVEDKQSPQGPSSHVFRRNLDLPEPSPKASLHSDSLSYVEDYCSIS